MGFSKMPWTRKALHNGYIANTNTTGSQGINLSMNLPIVKLEKLRTFWEKHSQALEPNCIYNILQCSFFELINHTLEREAKRERKFKLCKRNIWKHAGKVRLLPNKQKLCSSPKVVRTFSYQDVQANALALALAKSSGLGPTTVDQTLQPFLPNSWYVMQWSEYCKGIYRL